MFSRIALLLLLASKIFAQEGSFVLESVNAQGTALPPSTVEEITGLHVGAPVDKTGIENACKRLADSGLFGSVGYQYAPGAKSGYVVTLNLTDQPAAIAAVIDIPGVNQDEAWRWLDEKFPAFVHRIPEPESAENFLAHQLETHLAATLAGQHVVARLEGDLATHKVTVVFQPETLPQISSITFTNVQEFRSADLTAMLKKSMGTDGFTERRFKLYLEGVIRQAYEEHGMYRVSFTKLSTQATGPNSLAVTAEISEGPKFTLGEVQLSGDNLPRDAMLKAAAFERGKTADWRDLQQKVFALEKPVKRAGYYEAKAHTERVLQDEQRKLDLNVSFALGPLYHFGQITFVGLDPRAEAYAHKTWMMHSGDPYDFLYASDFLREFSKKVDLKTYKVQLQTKKAQGEPVMDETVTFMPK